MHGANRDMIERDGTGERKKKSGDRGEQVANPTADKQVRSKEEEDWQGQNQEVHEEN